MANWKKILVVASMIIVVASISIPVYFKISHDVKNFVERNVSEFQEELQIGFSYKGISPAVFRSVRIKGIEFYDLNSHDSILTIKSIRLNYSFGKLISGKVDQAFDEVVVSGTTVEFENIQKYQIIDKIRSVIALSNEQKNPDRKKVKKVFQIPFGFRLVNTKISFENNSAKALAELKTFRLKSGDENQFFVADMRGKFTALLKQNVLANLGTITGNFSLLGSITSNLDEFETQLRLSSVNAKQVRFKPLQLVCSYKDSVLSFMSSLNNANAKILCEYDLAQKNFSLESQAYGLSSKALVSFAQKTELNQLIEGITYNGNFDFHYFGKDKTFDYSFAGTTLVDDSPEYGSVQAIAEFSGTDKVFDLPTFKIDSKKLSAEMNLKANLKTYQSSGTFFLNHYFLKNGNMLSFEMYIDELAKGFMCFIPQLSFGEQFFTALQLDIIPEEKSVDYQFSVYDYMHQNNGSLGKITSDGSVLLEGKPYLQSSFSFDNLYLDAILNSATFFLDEKQKSALASAKGFVSSLIMSSEIYVSSDFKGLAYNIPFIVVANTKKDNSMMFASLAGNEQNTQVSRFDLLFAGQELSLNLFADYSEGLKNMFFNTNFAFNSIPYSLSGSVADSKQLILSGDYGFYLDATFAKAVKFALSLDTLPVKISENLISLSLNTNGVFNSKSDWNVDFKRLEVITSSKNADELSPHFSISGSADPYGAMFKNIQFVDSASVLSGLGSVVWNLGPDYLDSINLSFNLGNDTTSEKLALEGVFSNPSHKAFGEMNFKNDLFSSLMLSVNRCPSSRFLANQKSGTYINTELTVLGPLGNPGIMLKVYDTYIVASGTNVKLNVNANYEDGILSVIDSDVTYGKHNLSNLGGEFDLNTFAGNFKSDFATKFIAHNFTSPIELSVSSSKTQGEKLLSVPEKLDLKLLVNSLKCETFAVDQVLEVDISTSKGRVEFSSGDNGIVQGAFFDKKYLVVDVAENKRCSFNLAGEINNGIVDLNLNNFYLDFAYTSPFFYFPYFHGKGGIGKGALKISGKTSDLDFYGRIDVDDLIFTVPDYLYEDLYVKRTAIEADDNLFAINRFAAKTHSDGYIDGDVSTEIEGGGFANWKVNLKTRGESTAKAKFAYRNMAYQGEVKTTLDIVAIMKDSVSVKGNIYGTNLTATFSLPNSSANETSSTSEEDETVRKFKLSSFVDLDIVIGPRCYVQFPNRDNPMLRALVNPNTPVKFQLDSNAGYMLLDADLVLRGGSVVALSRTFYLREGRLVFAGNQIDPVITLRGEMRETDSDGNAVKIYLSALNQKLSNFNPRFTSSPAKSETEIMALLGQVIPTDDDDSSSFSDAMIYFVAGGINYLSQSLIVSRIENSLRDFFKFDIFSLHPTILQNAVIVNSDYSKEQNVGNYLDGTSVYIGKYIGKNMYLDALLNLEYMEGLVDPKRNQYGLSIEPEFGFEIESPFALIRWNVAPNLQSLTESWVPGTSLSLSWKFNF
ncbi:MAG: translocation/assembly module TamB [Treponemataceae bacterium]|nr:translocation/assembly module TamB [Treponemataceae bacterium]